MGRDVSKLDNRDYLENVQEVLNQVKKVIKGKDDVLFKTMITLLAKGHILIEDIPGVGKTTLAMAFSKAMGLETKRMQLRQMYYQVMLLDFIF